MIWRREGLAMPGLAILTLWGVLDVSVAVIMLQNNDCEVALEDGTVEYYACTAEPLHLLRNANPTVDVSPSEYTCGEQREAYCTLGIRNCAYCDAAIESEAHPLEQMYDNMVNSEQANMATSWQSITWVNYPTPLEINITVSFNKTYELQDDLVITFNSTRPQTMVLEKSVDFGATWQPLQYYSKKCREFTPGLSNIVRRSSPDDVICTQEYSLEVPYFNGQVRFDVVRDRYELFLGPSLTNYESLYNALNSTNLTKFLTFTNLRIRLLYPATDGKESLRKKQDLIRYYYAISDLKIVGGCYCNLHAKVCEETNGSTTCVCHHNTEGPNCERCKPLYNNRPWRPGFYLPYPDGQANECEKCQCNDHADSCVYNTSQQKAICIDCYHNTTGIHCEQCISGHYRNLTVDLNDPHVCVDCNCEPLGVFNEIMTCSSTGQCTCKPLVTGRQCDVCIDQYYGLLMEGNIEGDCKPCLCNRDGTMFQSKVCDKQTGQCPCKDFTTGRDCGECLDGYYDFPRARPWRDCINCNCDEGGATSHVCHKTTGQCACKEGVTGRRCNTAINGFYSPALDHLQIQPHSGTCEIATGISTPSRPFTGRTFMHCHGTETTVFEEFDGPSQQAQITWPHVPVLRYSLNHSSEAWPSASLEITVLGNSNVDLSWYHTNVNETIPAGCGEVTGYFYTFTFSNLTAGYGLAAVVTDGSYFPLDARCRYATLLTLSPAEGAAGPIDVDALVLAPDLSYSTIFRNSENATKDEFTECLEHTMASSTRTLEMGYLCETLSFSVGTEAYNGGLACDCDFMGSLPSTLCDPLGGQCQCKPGVTGRRCDRCKPGFFNFTTAGCKQCPVIPCPGDFPLSLATTGEEGSDSSFSLVLAVVVVLLALLLLIVLLLLFVPPLRRKVFGAIRRAQGQPEEVTYVDLGLKNPRSPIYSKNVYATYLDDEPGLQLDERRVAGTSRASRPVGETEGRRDRRQERGALRESFKEVDKYNSIDHDPSSTADCLMMQQINVDVDAQQTTRPSPALGTGRVSRARRSRRSPSLLSRRSSVKSTGKRRTGGSMKETDLSVATTGRERKSIRQTHRRSGSSGERVRRSSAGVEGVDNPVYCAEEPDGARVRPYIANMMVKTEHPPEVDDYRHLATRDTRPETDCHLGERKLRASRSDLTMPTNKLEKPSHLDQSQLRGLPQPTGHLPPNAKPVERSSSGKRPAAPMRRSSSRSTVNGQQRASSSSGNRVRRLPSTPTTRRSPRAPSREPTLSPRARPRRLPATPGGAGSEHLRQTEQDAPLRAPPKPPRPAGGADPSLDSGEIRACDCNTRGSASLVCDYNTGQCPCKPFVAQLGLNDTSGRPADRKCSACLRNYHGFESGTGCSLCVCSVAGSEHSQCDDSGKCLCKPTIGGLNCDRCQEGYFSFSETGCMTCNCSVAGSLSDVCDLVTGQCRCKMNVQGAKCDVCADDSFNLEGTNPDGCQKCFCYGHGTSCFPSNSFTTHLIHSNSIMDSNWTDSSPLTMMDNIWLMPLGLTTRDLMFVQAPHAFLGNQFHSYGQYLSFEVELFGGNELDMKGYRPFIIQGNGKTIYYDAENLTMTEDVTTISLRLSEHFWRYNSTAKPDYFNMYAILADVTAIHLQRAFGAQVLAISNISLVSARLALEGEPPAHYVEDCHCDTLRNVEGRSCSMCSEGTQRQTVNGSVYETCKPCDCSERAQTIPPLCLPSSGECLNCRNGTTGFHCDLCAANVEGVECDTCMAGFYGLGADGCRSCDCDLVGSVDSVCDKVTGQCLCQPHVVGRVCDECEDNHYNMQAVGCQECDSCYQLVYMEVQGLRQIRDNLTALLEQMKQQDNNTVLGPFSERLHLALHTMSNLLEFLADSKDVEGSITPQIEFLTLSLRHLEETLEIDVTSAIFVANHTVLKVENLISHAAQVHEETSSTVRDTHYLITGAISETTSAIERQLAELQSVESSLSQVSTGAMADANRVLTIVKEIEADTTAARETAESALENAQEATVIHQNTTRRLSLLQQFVSTVIMHGDEVSAQADMIHDNASAVLDEVLVALQNSTSMSDIPVDGTGLQAHSILLVEQAETLEESATVAENVIEAGNLTIIHEVEEAKETTAGLNGRVESLQTEADDLISRGKQAHKTALMARENDTQILQEAGNMLDVMQHFSDRAGDVEQQANASLTLVREVQSLSETSIQSATNLQEALAVTSTSAQDAMEIANSSQQVADEEIMKYKPVYEEAVAIDASSAPLLNDIQDVANSVHRATQEDIDPARITCSGLESQVEAVEYRTQTGVERAQQAHDSVSSTKSHIEAIMHDLRNIHELDLTAVDALRQRVRQARDAFDQQHLTEALSSLREAAQQQAEEIEQLKKRRDAAARAVLRVRDIQQQLRP